MELIHDGDKFVMKCTFHEKGVPKSAGFRWNPAEKCWWTDDAKKAGKLAEFANQEASNKLNEALKAHEEKINASKATDADIEIPIPEGLEFLPFQKAGISFCLDKPNVLIGDEMGLGKTIQAIGIININPDCNKVLVICPASLRLNWKNEMEKWLARPLSVAAIESKNGWRDADVVIINYDILNKFSKELRKANWDLLVADECHFIKNPKAMRTKQILGAWNEDPEKAIEPIPARKKLFLTGTPIVNRPIELFPILKHCGIFKNWKYYVTRFCNGHQNRYGWDVSGASNLDELQDILRSKIMVRRLKKDVLVDLPAKRRQVIELPPNGAVKAIRAEQKAQEKHLKKIEKLRIAAELAKASDNETNYQATVARLSAAQQIEFEEMSKIRHQTALAKVPQVIEHVREAIDSSGKVVLFAHHKDVISAIQTEFDNPAILVGDTSMAGRQAAIDRFQADENCKLFIGSIQAAGVGITLTASSHVIFAELDWVPGNLSQAEDRCHRIGQENFVLVQHLVLNGSIDATMAKRIIEKQEIIDSALDKDRPVDDQDIQAVTDHAQAASQNHSRKKIEKEAVEIPEGAIPLIHAALRDLATNCDDAQAKDGKGFNKIDTAIGKSLANYPALTPKQAVLGKIVIRKYKRQIEDVVYNEIFN